MAKKAKKPPVDPGLPPHDPNAEECVLGSVIIDSSCLEELRGILQPEHFFREQNRWVYEAMLSLAGRDEPLDQLTLDREIARCGHKVGLDYLSHLVSQVPTTLNAGYYARLVQSNYIRRLLIAGSAEMSFAAYDHQRPVTELIPHCYSILGQVESEIPLSSIFTNLRKQDSSPPVYFLDVKGQTINLETEGLLNYKKLQEKAVECLNWIPPEMKNTEWRLVLGYLLARVTVVEAPPEASLDHLIWMCACAWLRTKPSDDALEVFEAGGIIERDGEIFVKGDALFAGVKYKMKAPNLKPQEFWPIMKKHGVEKTAIRVGTKIIRCWRVNQSRLEENQEILESEEFQGGW